MSLSTENSANRESPAPAPERAALTEPPLTIIEARSGWQALELAELWRYRELLFFLAWRDVKVRYKQTALGVAWAILQPTLMMVVFTLVLGRFAGAVSGDIPYPLYVYAGLLPWNFFATAITSAGQSVVSAERLVTKVYFPRLAIPLAAVGAALVDFALAAVVLGALMAWYGVTPTWTILFAPGLMALLMLAALGIGVLLAALNVAYRDVRHALPFLVQLWFFASPSIYMATPQLVGAPAHTTAGEASANPAPATTEVRQPPGATSRATRTSPAAGRAQMLLGLNPIDGVIACLRATLLGYSAPWSRLIYPGIVLPCLLLVGCLYFRRVEDSFADII